MSFTIRFNDAPSLHFQSRRHRIQARLARPRLRAYWRLRANRATLGDRRVPTDSSQGGKDSRNDREKGVHRSGLSAMRTAKREREQAGKLAISPTETKISCVVRIFFLARFHGWGKKRTCKQPLIPKRFRNSPATRPLSQTLKPGNHSRAG